MCDVPQDLEFLQLAQRASTPSQIGIALNVKNRSFVQKERQSVQRCLLGQRCYGCGDNGSVLERYEDIRVEQQLRAGHGWKARATAGANSNRTAEREIGNGGQGQLGGLDRPIV